MKNCVSHELWFKYSVATWASGHTPLCADTESLHQQQEVLLDGALRQDEQAVFVECL